MSERVQCKSCDGTYARIQADGLRYFHACPPVVDPKTGVAMERPNKRDENVTIDDAGRRVGIHAEGKGVTPLVIAPEP